MSFSDRVCDVELGSERTGTRKTWNKKKYNNRNKDIRFAANNRENVNFSSPIPVCCTRRVLVVLISILYQVFLYVVGNRFGSFN